ncbi:unnamed protein product [Rhodiola kirilowii]
MILPSESCTEKYVGTCLLFQGTVNCRHILHLVLHRFSNEEVEALYVETNTYMLASHLYWALWSLIQAKMSPIDFDYLEYFFLRYNEYKRRKKECTDLARSYLSQSRAE